MEQAINQFTKGLLMDTNPMMQENTTLSDALNATITTLNGNELILQNDMGNRRVDHAYLPSGYEPVGIKEYGGVIYIACYNPITNKGQVGSFPSPERRMEIPDVAPTATKLDTLFDVDEKHDLKSDTVLLPLTSGQVLHAGDKFVIYDNDITDYKNEISNYENIQLVGSDKDSLVYSPKNKTYTLSVGVLNSQNEFMDITKSLCRWQDDGTGKFKILKYNKQSELYKFNDGYFIPGNYIPQGLTGDDANLVKARQTIEANTYSYKLVGPLYLKVHLNHFQDFNYNMYADKDGDNYINLYIESTIVYNCPDYAKTYKSEGSDKYRTLKLIREPLNDKWFDFTLTPMPKNTLDDWTEKDINPDIDINTFKSADKLYIGNSTIPQSAPGQQTIDTNPYDVNPGREQEVDIDDEVDTDIEYNYESSYDEDNDLYTLKFVQKYKHFLSSNVKKLHYTIRPYVLWKNHTTNSDNKGYLKDLMAEGNIDTRKLGTNVADITEWRFFNYTDSTRLIYSFEAYPKFGTKFETLDLEFYKCSEDGVSEKAAFAIEGLEFRNGRSTVNFNWGEYNIKPRELYLVKIKVAGADDIVERWFLSTELMNDCFNTSKDFGDKDDADVKDKLTIKLDSTNLTNDRSSIIYGTTSVSNSENKIGQWIQNNDGEIELAYRHTYNVKLDLVPSIKIKDEELYPPYFSVSGDVNMSHAQLLSLENINNEIKQNATKAGTKTGDFNYIDFNYLSTPTGSNSYQGTITFRDIFSGETTTEGTVHNPFGKVEDYFKYAIFPSPGSKYLYNFGGIVQDFSKDEKHHRLGVMGPQTMEKIFYAKCFTDTVENQARDDKGKGLTSNDDNNNIVPVKESVQVIQITDAESESGDSDKIIDDVRERTFSKYKGQIYDAFNRQFGYSTFIYFFEANKDVNGNTHGDVPLGHMRKTVSYIDMNDDALTFDQAARVWWRTLQGNWALLSTPFTKPPKDEPNDYESYFYEYMLKHLFGSQYSNVLYQYCDTVSLLELQLRKPGELNYSFNEQYTFIPQVSATFDYSNLSKHFDTIDLFSTLDEYHNEEIIDLKPLQSMSNFQDKCLNMISSAPSNVAIVNNKCFELDSDQQPLDPSCFYEYNTGKLYKLNLPYKKSNVVGYNIYNSILYDESSSQTGNIIYRFDKAGQADRRTVIDYSGAIIVKDRS